jgi:hypothetical protein
MGDLPIRHCNPDECSFVNDIVGSAAHCMYRGQRKNVKVNAVCLYDFPVEKENSPQIHRPLPLLIPAEPGNPSDRALIIELRDGRAGER